jgi:hypothetical protein
LDFVGKPEKMPPDALKMKIEFLPQSYDLRGKIKLKGKGLTQVSRALKLGYNL